MIRCSCPECATVLEFSDMMAGQKAACSKCGRNIRVPSKAVPSKDSPRKKQAESSQTAVAAEIARQPLQDEPEDEDDDREERSSGDSPRRRPDKAAVRKIFDDLPADLPEEVHALGEPTALYKAEHFGQLGKTICLIFGIGFIVAGLICAIGWLRGGVGADAFVWAPACAILGGILVFSYFANLNWSVVVFPEGLLVISGDTPSVIRWADVEKVWQAVTERYVNGAYIFTSRNYTIKTRNGKEFIFNKELPDVQSLGETIQAEVTRVLLPEMTDACNRGEQLSFGPFTVDQSGLTLEKSFLPWNEIQAVKLERGEFVISKKGKWLNWGKVTVPNVPNVMIFLALVDRILGIDEGTPFKAKKFW